MRGAGLCWGHARTARTQATHGNMHEAPVTLGLETRVDSLKYSPPTDTHPPCRACRLLLQAPAESVMMPREFFLLRDFYARLL